MLMGVAIATAATTAAASHCFTATTADTFVTHTATAQLLLPNYGCYRCAATSAIVALLLKNVRACLLTATAICCWCSNSMPENDYMPMRTRMCTSVSPKEKLFLTAAYLCANVTWCVHIDVVHSASIEATRVCMNQKPVLYFSIHCQTVCHHICATTPTHS
eukprot:3102-Heterococcus_DN1.PRE.4